MEVIHTLPLLIRSDCRQADMAMAIECLMSLARSKDHHVVIYNQGSLSFEEVESLVYQSGVSADILGTGNNEGIAKARQACFDFIGCRYPDVPFISEIHVDMLFPPNWYSPLVAFLISSDEPIVTPGILTASGELQPLGERIELPDASEAILKLLEHLPRDGLQPGFVHPVLHRAKLLREIGGYDVRFLQGKQGYEDDSLLLGYAYYMGTRNRWRPKCCLSSWVYHATLSQRMSLSNLSEEFLLNEEGLARQYGSYGFRQLSSLHGDQNDFLSLYTKYIPPTRSEASMAHETESGNPSHVWDRIWSGPVSYDWDPLSQTVYQEIRDVIASIAQAQIAEAGSGTGKVSLRLAEDGADVTLIDFSERALKNSRQAFFARKVAATFLQADIRSTSLPPSTFDLTWNAGVLEHFDEEEQVEMVREMGRITKPGGIVLIMTPNARCLPYLVGKTVAEKEGTWMYGKEIPVASLKNIIEKSGLLLLEEKHTGFLDSLAFLDFIQGAETVKTAIRLWYEALPFCQRRDFPGYLLVSICKVPIH
ncbi:class I SAM-dependent methyltransferase [Cohnella sp. JJ-181]|uniref:class I SAM-dependent methyltransferase n=1 Tax=Cohnella rhizoplanae TaxID=2974897 RepID=UPI0022FFA109|nr:class I SAM-dependent methyltransferase [Cohnella sp. JJ-181]CAI6085456.1 tRNA 5-carboxymethoxyuridine methyltransferase [Cohnella sp. JJ-181]